MNDEITYTSPAKEHALKAIDALIDSPHQLVHFSLKEQVLDIFGGREWCVDGVSYDILQAAQGLLKFATSEHLGVYHHAGVKLLEAIMYLYDSALDVPQVRAELIRWVIECDGNENNDRKLTDEFLENIARQHELMLELDKLRAQERDIKYYRVPAAQQKEAA